jgi:hypothetical protein
MKNNGISKRQNESGNIELLAAQRELYSEAKRMTFIQFVISVLFPITLPILRNLCINSNRQLAFIVLLSILLVIFNVFYFEKTVKSKRLAAAKIQELFDTNVLKIKWNEEVCGSKIFAHSGVKLKAEQYKKKSVSLDNLMDWYSKHYSSVDISAGRIMCQKVNVTWDNEVREKFQKFLLLVLIASSVLVISYAIVENKTFTETLISIIAPLFPIGLYIFKRYCENKETIVRIEKLNNRLEIVWESLMNKETKVIELEISSRKLQDSIFKHRSNALMIWDWFYFKYRTNQEVDMGEVVQMVVSEYQNTKR